MSDDPILAALARLEAGQATLQAEVKSVRTDFLGELARLEAGQTALRDDFLGELARLEAGQTSLRADFLAELGKTRAEIMGKIEGLQHRLDGLDDHLTMGLGNSDRVERKSDGVAEQNRILAEQMTTMHKIVRRLEGRINDLDRK